MSNDNTRDQDRVCELMKNIGNPAVSLSFADASGLKYVSVTGTAFVSSDRADNRKVSM
jgi:general stress protein 26